MSAAKEDANLSEGVLVRWMEDGTGIMKDDKLVGPIIFDGQNFLRKSEASHENVGRRCRYIVNMTGDSKIYLTKIRILTGPQKRDARSKQDKNSGEGNKLHSVTPGSQGKWELVCSARKKPIDMLFVSDKKKSSELVKFLETYRFLGKIERFNSDTKCGIISSNQLSTGKIKFNESSVRSHDKDSRLVAGKKVFFFLALTENIEVTQVHSAADYMTEQRISGVIYTWNGRYGKVRLPNLKIPILLYPDNVSTGNVEMMSLNLKLNCTVLLNGKMEVEAKDVNLYTNSFRPRGSMLSNSDPSKVDASSFGLKNSSENQTESIYKISGACTAEFGDTSSMSNIQKVHDCFLSCTEEHAKKESENINLKSTGGISGNNGNTSESFAFNHLLSNPLYKRKSSFCENQTQGKGLNPNKDERIRKPRNLNLPNKKMRNKRNITLSDKKDNTSQAKLTKDIQRNSKNQKKLSSKSFDMNQNQVLAGDYSAQIANLSDETESLLQIKESADLMKQASRTKMNLLAERTSSCATKEDLELIFAELKPDFSRLLSDPTGNTVMHIFINKVAKLSRSLEEKMARIVLTCYPGILETRSGCEILKSCFDYFQYGNRQILAEGICDLDEEQIAKFWIHGTAVFKAALGIMDEKEISALISNLSGSMVRFSCHFKSYIGVKELVIHARNFTAFQNIVEEFNFEFSSLALDRFASKVLVTLIETSSAFLEEKIFSNLRWNIEDLATHSHGQKVIVSALLNFSSDYQDLMINQVFIEKSGDANSTLVNLALHKDGHVVIIVMLQVSYGRHSHQALKSGLFKQEILAGNEYGSRVLDKIRMM